MNKNDAIDRALEYVNSHNMNVGEVSDVRRVTAEQLVTKAKDCPDDLAETYKSVLSKFRDRWVVDFSIVKTDDVVNCPGTKSICVYDTGEIEEASNL